MPDLTDASPDMQNFMKKLYENENFQQEKTAIENQISEASQVTVESKNFLGEMDTFLHDLEKWKNTR